MKRRLLIIIGAAIVIIAVLVIIMLTKGTGENQQQIISADTTVEMEVLVTEATSINDDATTESITDQISSDSETEPRSRTEIESASSEMGDQMVSTDDNTDLMDDDEVLIGDYVVEYEADEGFDIID